MAAERKAIQSFRPSDFTTPWAERKGLTGRRKWHGVSRALTMRGVGGGDPLPVNIAQSLDEMGLKGGLSVQLSCADGRFSFSEGWICQARWAGLVDAEIGNDAGGRQDF